MARIAAFHAERYVPGNVVIAAAGSVDHDRLVELAAARVSDVAGTAPAPDPAPAERRADVRFERKDTEQYHVCLGGIGYPRDDERRFALRVLDTIFGGTSSSRLFQQVREQRGLAYAVYSFSGQYADTGQVGLYVGTRAENLAPALEVVGEELARLRREPATDDELARAKENLKGRVVLSLESTGARMNRLGSHLLGGVQLLSVDEVIAAIDAVSHDDVAAVATELYAADRLSLAGIGPDEDVFRTATEAVRSTAGHERPEARSRSSRSLTLTAGLDAPRR